MNTAIIGLGNISKIHLNAIKNISQTNLVAVCDADVEKVNLISKTYNCKGYTDYLEMLKCEMIDVTHICTPHYLHFQMAIDAVKFGCNVILEKPCGINFEQINYLKEFEKTSQKQIGICFQNRYNSSTNKMLEIINNQKYGKVTSISGQVSWKRDEQYYKSASWRGTVEKEGGGVLINQAIHTIDLMGLFGGGFKKVTGTTDNVLLKNIIEVEDTATVFFEFKNEAKGVLFATVSNNQNSPIIIDVNFEKARVRIEGDDIYEIDKSGYHIINMNENKCEDGQSYWGKGHQLLIEDFYNCVKSGRKFSIDISSGSQAIEAVLSVYKNMKQKKNLSK